jgi:hypothetical protein
MRRVRQQRPPRRRWESIPRRTGLDLVLLAGHEHRLSVLCRGERLDGSRLLRARSRRTMGCRLFAPKAQEGASFKTES